MSFVFFLFVSTLFLFFFANYVLSPERNPRFNALSEHAHAPAKETIEIVSHVLNGIGVLLTIGLIAAVPFFRVIAAFAMVALVVRFFYARFTASTESEDTIDPPALHEDEVGPCGGAPFPRNEDGTLPGLGSSEPVQPE